MKKFIICALIALALGVNNSSSYAQSYSRNGNTFQSTQQSNRRSSTPPIKTKYTYKDSDGITYTIYVSPNSGSCFILKKSKRTGKEYRKYLGEEISRQICKELDIEYKPKRS